jgi:hypothetical protein
MIDANLVIYILYNLNPGTLCSFVLAGGLQRGTGQSACTNNGSVMCNAGIYDCVDTPTLRAWLDDADFILLSRDGKLQMSSNLISHSNSNC